MSAVVYFLSDEHGSIKVGWSRNLDIRLTQIRSTNGAGITVLGSAPGSQRQEKEIHRLLAEFRLHGEWFRDCEEVRRVIADLLKNGLPPATGTPRVFGQYDITGPTQQAQVFADIVLRCSGVISPDPSISRLREIENEFSIPSGTLWKLRYRPPEDLGACAYYALRDAALASVGKAQVRLLQFREMLNGLIEADRREAESLAFVEAELDRLRREAAALGIDAGVAHPAVREAQTLLANATGERAIPEHFQEE